MGEGAPKLQEREQFIAYQKSPDLVVVTKSKKGRYRVVVVDFKSSTQESRDMPGNIRGRTKDPRFEAEILRQSIRMHQDNTEGRQREGSNFTDRKGGYKKVLEAIFSHNDTEWDIITVGSLGSTLNKWEAGHKGEDEPTERTRNVGEERDCLMFLRQTSKSGGEDGFMRVSQDNALLLRQAQAELLKFSRALANLPSRTRGYYDGPELDISFAEKAGRAITGLNRIYLLFGQYVSDYSPNIPLLGGKYIQGERAMRMWEEVFMGWLRVHNCTGYWKFEYLGNLQFSTSVCGASLQIIGAEGDLSRTTDSNVDGDTDGPVGGLSDRPPVTGTPSHNATFTTFQDQKWSEVTLISNGKQVEAIDELVKTNVLIQQRERDGQMRTVQTTMSTEYDVLHKGISDANGGGNRSYRLRSKVDKTINQPPSHEKLAVESLSLAVSEDDPEFRMEYKGVVVTDNFRSAAEVLESDRTR